MNGRTLSCLMVVCLLEAGRVEAQGIATAPPADSALLQRRREAIAHALEANIHFRTLLDNGAPKLVEAKIRGPFEQSGGLFGHRETAYCVSAKLVLWPIPDVRTAVIRVDTSQPGVERLKITNFLNLGECRLAGPFSELELARHKRRQALGKTD
jgi:hypothetical protein